MIITTKDLQPVSYCARGARRWFAEHGLDWSKFVFEGLPEEDILATGDPMAIKLVEEARRRAAEEDK
ncbi:tail assembly protein [Burkholderia phage vB_BceS_AH2]|uniref:Tail assembly protein n=1 Tax=Burkholderia phage vB_BceS_AH2 TaxID=1133022 RepID=I6NP96_9CAUD|nr:tail assembly chaperone [Burkholderia phage vB_BceS_AH2]AEY69563.1 tail assembly protein [Burkholderia phage vB_BceS_AH2]